MGTLLAPVAGITSFFRASLVCSARHL